MLYATDENGDGVFENIQIQDPHELIGQRGYGFLLTGTITSLEANKDLIISSVNDTIIRGNINLFGDNSSLTVQSNNWVYWEGEADVTGDISLYGGIDLDGVTKLSSAKDTSIYVHATSTINSKDEATTITLSGGEDVDIFGRVVAGANIGSSGVSYNGTDSIVNITAGEQIYIDTAIVASKAINITTTEATSNEDDGKALVLTSSSGLTVAGLTSDNTGGNITIDTVGDIEAIGMILSGGSVTQTFDNDGNLETETFNWNEEDSFVTINSLGKVSIAGNVFDINNDSVEIGGVIRSKSGITIDAGEGADNIGIYLPGSAKLVTYDVDSVINLSSSGDASLYGLIIAGGELVDARDSDGKYLGSEVELQENSTSEIHISSDSQISLGRDLIAGSIIDLRGGAGSKIADNTEVGEEGYYVNRQDQGIVLGANVHLKTLAENSEITLSSSGDLAILASAWNEEIIADGFSESAYGILSENVTLEIEFDDGTNKITKDILITKENTANNNGLSDLVSDIQEVLNSIGFGDITAGLSDGKIMFTSDYAFVILAGSSSAKLLGFNSTENRNSKGSVAIDATTKGSIVNLGKDGETNGLFIYQIM